MDLYKRWLHSNHCIIVSYAQELLQIASARYKSVPGNWTETSGKPAPKSVCLPGLELLRTAVLRPHFLNSKLIPYFCSIFYCSMSVALSIDREQFTGTFHEYRWTFAHFVVYVVCDLSDTSQFNQMLALWFQITFPICLLSLVTMATVRPLIWSDWYSGVTLCSLALPTNQ